MSRPHEHGLRQTLAENPCIAKAFKETLDELSKPENVSEMANHIGQVVSRMNEARSMHMSDSICAPHRQ